MKPLAGTGCQYDSPSSGPTTFAGSSDCAASFMLVS